MADSSRFTKAFLLLLGAVVVAALSQSFYVSWWQPSAVQSEQTKTRKLPSGEAPPKRPPSSPQLSPAARHVAYQIDPGQQSQDVESLLTLHDSEEVAARREALIAYLWGEQGFPQEKRPAQVIENIQDARFARLSGLETIDKLVVELDYGLRSYAYHFRPRQPNKRLVIYHQGHLGGFERGIETIEFFVSRGYHVVALAMPLVGMNNRPVVVTPRFGRIVLTKHDHLKMLDRPFQPFLEPVAVVLNHALAEEQYQSVSMVGLSGGGWTATLCAAIDPRIQTSYPVAGSYPIFLRTRNDGHFRGAERNQWKWYLQGDWGDFEQTEPSLYRIANYLELYVIGSSGEGRRQVQVLNRFDSCCFNGPRFQTYEEIVARRVQSIGPGSFRVFLDESHHEHKISPVALAEIERDIQGDRNGLSGGP